MRAIAIVKPLTVNNEDENRRDTKVPKAWMSGARNSIQPKLMSRNVTSIDTNSPADGNKRPWATVSL